MSHLRFGPEPILSAYEIQQDADYIACGNTSYVHKFDLLKPLKRGGAFVLNSPYETAEELEKYLPKPMMKHIADNDIKLYNVHATKIAKEVGLGQRINIVMQTAFYHLSGVLPRDQALELLKGNVESTYKKKGPKVVQANKDCIDRTVDALREIHYDKAKWSDAANAATKPTGVERVEGFRDIMRGPNTWAADGGAGRDAAHGTYVDATSFVKNIMDPVLALEGDQLPVSSFTPGGYMPAGTTNFEKRGIAPEVPVWKPENCTQCNYCTIVCPHAVIRPFLFTKDELKAAPDGHRSLKAQGGAELAGLNYSINLATMDCTGCEVCVNSCPDDALFMAPFDEAAHAELPMFEFGMSVPNKGHLVDKFSVKGSQFQEPLMEFSGACSGCGETPYVKLATQLFGDRMMIANASGCSSVWGGTSTTNPYTVNEAGHGPAWGRSLFEDNAEYGLGMALATTKRRDQLRGHVRAALSHRGVTMSDELRSALMRWTEHYDDADMSSRLFNEAEPLLAAERAGQPLLENVYARRGLMPKLSQWIVGGDGWAYDIGFGGLDHVMSRGENVNVLVLDTEMYSNTGGQVSKASPMSGLVKYAASGKTSGKKDLGQIAMMNEDIYVASIAIGADMAQTVQALREAESFPGTSLVIAYSPCIDWGIDMTKMAQVQKAAVDSGYWPLYRYDPRKLEAGDPAFQLDSKRIRLELETFLKNENRFSQLTRNMPHRAAGLHGSLAAANERRMESNKRAAMDDSELLDLLKKKVGEQGSEKITILYGSETGNTADLAKALQYEFKRRGVRAVVSAMDDYDVAELPNEQTVINLLATCGQGEFPVNSRDFYKELCDADLPADYLSGVNFATFGMGDSGYVFFNETARLVDERMAALGARRMLPRGDGDDQSEDKWETAWADWFPDLMNETGAPPPPAEMPAAQHVAVIGADGGARADRSQLLMPRDVGGTSTLVPLVTSSLMTPGGRDVRFYEWDIEGTGIEYEVGDALGVWSTNPTDRVKDFLDWYGHDFDDDVELLHQPSRSPQLPQATTVGQLFTQVLDVFGRPKRQFYEVLGSLATDPDEKARLAHLVSKEGRDDLRAIINQQTSYADLMREFPSSRPSLDYLLDFVPNIKPRLYSIGSAPEMHPDKIQLCVVEEDWQSEKYGQRRGQSTWFLRNQSAGDENRWGTYAQPFDAPNLADKDAPRMQWAPDAGVTSSFGVVPAAYTSDTLGVTGSAPFGHRVPRERAPKIPVRVNPAVVHTPDTAEAPCVMVGLGTGIAPFRAFIQQRAAWRDQGKNVGPMLLYFGARYEATEYLFGDEIEQYHKDGVLTHLKKAFSRDQEEKIYAQHRIAEDPHLLYDYMVRKNGYFYLCGPAGGMPAQMKQAVIDAFVEAGGHSQAEATKMVTDMQINGRYNVEVW